MVSTRLRLPILVPPRRFCACIESDIDSCPPATTIVASPVATACAASATARSPLPRSEEHTSELQSLMRTSYAVFCLKKKTTTTPIHDPADFGVRKEADHTAHTCLTRTTQ